MCKRFTVLFVLLMMIISPSLFGQDNGQVQLGEKETQAIRCWLRSDKTSVRIGETFILTLTCQVTETEYEKVVPKEEALDSSVVSFSPYEIVEGWRHQDIKRDTFRFFQYQYKLKLVGDVFFGKEIPVPPLEIKYTIERKITENQSLDTKEQTYVLPALNIKVSSLVPENTKDIRDSNDDNFKTVKAAEQKAYIAFAVAGLFLFLPFSVFLMPALRHFVNWRKSVSNGTGFSNPDLLKRMNNELATIGKAKDSTGWNNELVGKVLTIVRIMGAISLSKQINQLPTKFESKGLEGQLKLRKGFIWPKKVLISSNLTPESADLSRRALDSKWADDFLLVFNGLNDVRYGINFEEKDLDRLFYMTVALLKRIRFSNRLIIKKWSSLREAAKEWRPVWRHS